MLRVIIANCQFSKLRHESKKQTFTCITIEFNDKYKFFIQRFFDSLTSWDWEHYNGQTISTKNQENWLYIFGSLRNKHM